MIITDLDDQGLWQDIFLYKLDYDKRNQRFQPSEGFRSTFTQSLPLVSENYEIKNVYEISKYVPFDNGMVTNIIFGAAAVNGVTGKDVRISKRLYVPERRLRGFKKGKVGPIENNDYVGGNYRAMFNINTTLPNLFPESQNTDFRLFFVQKYLLLIPILYDVTFLYNYNYLS